MRTHWSSNAETWDDLTAHGVSGGGYEALKAAGSGFSPYQGTYAYEWGVDPVAGWAWGYKDLGAALPLGSKFRIATRFMLVRDGDDWPSVLGPVVTAGTQAHIIRAENAAASQGAYLQIISDAGSQYTKKFRFGTNVGATAWCYFNQGFQPGVWYLLELFYYMHNTDGYGQIYVNGSKKAEFSGVDTYGGDIGRLRLGPSWKGSSVTRLCTYFDVLAWDDQESPLPPDKRSRAKVSSSLAGSRSRGGLVTGPQAMREYRELRRVA